MAATLEQQLRILRDKRQQLKKQNAANDLEIKKTNVAILKLLNKTKKTEWVADGLSTQIIQAYKTEYDWDAIREAVDPEVWSRITQEVPSEEALTVEIGRGSVSPTVVAKHSTKTAREPYIKVDKAAAPKEEEV